MGFKYTTDLFEIRAQVSESAANTFTEQTINVNLDSLNREILIIMSVDLDCGTPSLVAGSSTSVNAQLTKNSKTAAVNISDPACVSQFQKQVRSLGAPDPMCFLSVDDLPAAQADLPYLAISATDDLFLGVAGGNNVGPVSAHVLIRARRARADADTYAALITSEANLG